MKFTSLFLLLTAAAPPADIPLDKVDLRNAKGETTAYHGHPALKLTSADGTHQAFAAIPNLSFRDGVIEVEVSGAPAPGASEDARGFIGVTFRHQKDPARFEILYIRPTNARADDQLRRNHTVQYSAEPDWPWDRLRKEAEGVYESYADMQAGEWTHMKIVVKGQNAALYINHADQPCLVVHDLKLGNAEGGVALWIGSDTVGYFRDLRIAN